MYHGTIIVIPWQPFNIINIDLNDKKGGKIFILYVEFTRQGNLKCNVNQIILLSKLSDLELLNYIEM